MLHWLARPAPRWFSPALGTLVVGTGLALNRNVFLSSLQREALIADAVLIAAAAAAALAMRVRGVSRLALAGGASAALLFLLGSAFPRSAPPAEARSVEHPDAVTLLIDTLHEDVFRRVVAETEERRRFREAMRGSAWFGNYVAAAPRTAPSVASIMTGQHPQEHGFERLDPERGKRHARINQLAASATTLAERLDEAGYHTAGMVTNYALDPATGMGRGYDRYETPAAAGDPPADRAAPRPRGGRHSQPRGRAGRDPGPAGVGGARPPDRFSVGPLVVGEPGPVREHALSGSIEDGPRQRAIRYGDLKLIEYPNGERPPELYDLGRDPGEQDNLADRSERIAEARAALDRSWSRLAPPPESAPVELTPEMREQFEALG